MIYVLATASPRQRLGTTRHDSDECEINAASSSFPESELSPPRKFTLVAPLRNVKPRPSRSWSRIFSSLYLSAALAIGVPPPIAEPSGGNERREGDAQGQEGEGGDGDDDEEEVSREHAV